MITTPREVRVADEVWVAVALLHQEHPDRADFSLKEIESRLAKEHLTPAVRRGVYPHMSVHCVANTPPNPARYRMLFATGPSRRRLFRSGDRYDPGREGGKVLPRREDLPGEYHGLLDWHERQWASRPETDPLLDLARRHQGLWNGVDADEYVRELRKGWK